MSKPLTSGQKRDSHHMDNASSPELRPEKSHRTDRDVSVIPLHDLQPTSSPVKIVSPPKTMDSVKLYQMFLELKAKVMTNQQEIKKLKMSVNRKMKP